MYKCVMRNSRIKISFLLSEGFFKFQNQNCSERRAENVAKVANRHVMLAFCAEIFATDKTLLFLFVSYFITSHVQLFISLHSVQKSGNAKAWFAVHVEYYN